MSNTVQVRVEPPQTQPPPAAVPSEVALPASSAAIAPSAAIRALAEPIAAVARLSGGARVFVAGCRRGDGATTIAGAVALDLSVRLGIDTLLVDAELGESAAAQDRGYSMHIEPGASAHLWLMRPPAAAHLSGAEAEQLRATFSGYSAAVIDLGAVREDARMLALARPADPVLIVARYGCTRRDELAATVEVIKVAGCRIGGVILNAYHTPAADRLRWLGGLTAEDQ